MAANATTRLAATRKLLTPIVDRVAAGRQTGADDIGIAVGGK